MFCFFNLFRRIHRQLDDETRAERCAREAAACCARAELPRGGYGFGGCYEARVSALEACVQGRTPAYNEQCVVQMS
jgi:hypothetical protein